LVLNHSMSDHRASPAAELSPETVRQYLAVNAQRELDALRENLDVRLVALEAAVAAPDQPTSLEHPSNGAVATGRGRVGRRACVS
jgi:hypothetical protein